MTTHQPQRAKLPLRAMLIALAWTFPALAQSTGGGAPNLEATVDSSISPGDDFYSYANGAWLKATTIPEGREKWSTRDELEAQTRRRIAALLDDAKSAPAGSTARKVADFRSAFMNEEAIEKKGLTSLRPLLDRIDKIQNKRDLTIALARSMRADVDPMGWGMYQSASILGLSVEQSIHGEKNNSAFLMQGGLTLNDRDDYLSTDATKVALRTRYQDSIAKLLALAKWPAGVPRPLPSSFADRATALAALETLIAQSQATADASAQDHNADTIWTRADFTKRAPGLDWNLFFTTAGLNNEQQLVVWQPSAVTGLAALVASQPLGAWKDYLRLHLLIDYAEVLPRAIAEEVASLRGGSAPSRADRAVALTQRAMSDAVGTMYVERYFPAEQKARLERITENVRAALIERVKSATWMSPATKASSLLKLQTLYVGLGYPDAWEDYASLTIDPNDPLENLRRVNERAYRNVLARLGKPVDLKFWAMSPQTVGAILVFQQNSYVMSAALLEAPKYDHASSDAAAYGSFGALIGHDLTHYIDLLGAEYDVEHRMRHWWTADDAQHFASATQPLVDQFSAYQPLAGVSLNGKLTLTENLADLGGLAAAFDAYRKTLGARVSDADYVRAQDREFFLAYAQTQRRKISESGLRKQATTSDHAPEETRAATVRNLDAWYTAFDVRPGQRLYLQPAARVRVW